MSLGDQKTFFYTLIPKKKNDYLNLNWELGSRIVMYIRQEAIQEVSMTSTRHKDLKGIVLYEF